MDFKYRVIWSSKRKLFSHSFELREKMRKFEIVLNSLNETICLQFVTLNNGNSWPKYLIFSFIKIKDKPEVCLSAKSTYVHDFTSRIKREHPSNKELECTERGIAQTPSQFVLYANNFKFPEASSQETLESNYHGTIKNANFQRRTIKYFSVPFRR